MPESWQNPKGNRNPSTRRVPEGKRVNERPFLQGKGLSITFWIIQEDSYKEKTSTSRKRGQPYTIKAPIHSQIKVRIIHPFLAL